MREDDQPNEEDKRKPAICRFFKNGNCKHGIKGKECNYTHPKVCIKYTQHGTRQPRGCNLGKSCQDFHPKMCINSLRKGECFSKDCRFNHIKGTKRQPPVTRNNVAQHLNEKSTPMQRTVQDGNTQEDDTGHFLEMIRLLKTEILHTFDQKLSSITSQISILQSQQMQMPMHMPIPTPYMQPPLNMSLRPQPPPTTYMQTPPNMSLIRPQTTPTANIQPPPDLSLIRPQPPTTTYMQPPPPNMSLIRPQTTTPMYMIHNQQAPQQRVTNPNQQ